MMLSLTLNPFAANISKKFLCALNIVMSSIPSIGVVRIALDS
jgi:hypothetical protein